MVRMKFASSSSHPHESAAPASSAVLPRKERFAPPPYQTPAGRQNRNCGQMRFRREIKISGEKGEKACRIAMKSPRKAIDSRTKTAPTGETRRRAADLPRGRGFEKVPLVRGERQPPLSPLVRGVRKSKNPPPRWRGYGAFFYPPPPRQGGVGGVGFRVEGGPAGRERLLGLGLCSSFRCQSRPQRKGSPE